MHVLHDDNYLTTRQRDCALVQADRTKSTPLTAAQKAAAKQRAEDAGRPYPNLVDNIWASRQPK